MFLEDPEVEIRSVNSERIPNKAKLYHESYLSGRHCFNLKYKKYTLVTWICRTILGESGPKTSRPGDLFKNDII